MCLIIEIPKGKTVSKEIIRSAMTRNSDGVGIMVDGEHDKWLDIKLDTVKGKIDDLTDKDIGVHFRMATHGPVIRELAHPFPLVDGSLLMHNGILSRHLPTKEEEANNVSDTLKFINSVVNPHIRRCKFLRRGINTEHLVQEAGSSAFLHMDTRGAMTRFGNGWNVHEDCHFSNTYAWDSPQKMSQDYWQTSSVGFSQSQWNDCLDLAEDYNYAIGEDLRDILSVHTDKINLSYQSVSYNDGDLLDAVFFGDLSVDDFLYICDTNTVIRLYTMLVRNHDV